MLETKKENAKIHKIHKAKNKSLGKSLYHKKYLDLKLPFNLFSLNCDLLITVKFIIPLNDKSDFIRFKQLCVYYFNRIPLE